MYLTDKRNGIQREPSDHQDLEVLLESFAKQVEEIVNETETTQVRSAHFHAADCARALTDSVPLEQYTIYPRDRRTDPRLQPKCAPHARSQGVSPFLIQL